MIFDVAVYLVMFVAVIGGFHAGFVRSALTMVAYVVAMPLAVAATPYVAPLFGGQGSAGATSFASPGARNSFLFFGVFLAIGIILGALIRTAVNEAVGARISIPDRLAGAALGVIRIGLVAVVLVLAF